jgi:uncharacterized protein DUF5989/saxitoxin biosynthesis operon SxtJ-like protein
MTPRRGPAKAISDSPITPHHRVIAGSDRNFGLVFAAVFALIWVWPWVKGGLLRWWALVFAVAFLVAGLFAPRVLAPLNKLWFRFGLLLNRVINPIVMAIVFVGAIVPTGLLLRAFGKDLLRLKRQPESDSYWIVREPPGPQPGSMSKQF